MSLSHLLTTYPNGVMFPREAPSNVHKILTGVASQGAKGESALASQMTLYFGNMKK